MTTPDPSVPAASGLADDPRQGLPLRPETGLPARELAGIVCMCVGGTLSLIMLGLLAGPDAAGLALGFGLFGSGVVLSTREV